MTAALLVPAALQAIAMAIDEGWFHRRRGLPRFERLGHPVDTASVALCYAWASFEPPTRAHAFVYGALALASCLLVTKDEGVHAKLCTAGEHWLHAILFVLHPIVFAAIGVLWWTGRDAAAIAAMLAAIAFAIYQLVAWSTPWRPRATAR